MTSTHDSSASLDDGTVPADADFVTSTDATADGNGADGNGANGTQEDPSSTQTPEPGIDPETTDEDDRALRHS
ncbi:MAG: hypothetical protein H7146_02255 [Burkholderiaceae bacterium]|nr:hypothetical protein [Microbacteriaceae bacterium]